MGPQKTTSAVAVITLFDIIKSHGMSAETLEKRTGINRKKMDDPDARITMTQFLTLWEIAENITANPAIGLTLHQHYKEQTMHFVASMALNCKNNLEAIQAWAKYELIISNSGRIDLVTKDDLYGIRYTNLSPRHENRWFPEHHVAIAVYYSRKITQSDFKPIQVEFRHGDPGYAEVYKEIFQCPVLFNQEENQVWLGTKEGLLRPIPGNNPHIRAILEKHAKKSIKKLARDITFKRRIQEYIVRHLHQGIVTIQSAADAMNMDRSTLHRHLKKEGTSFREILTQTREQLAQKHLASGLSVSQTGYLLGFSDPSAFQRAFKRWTGKSPGQFKSDTVKAP